MLLPFVIISDLFRISKFVLSSQNIYLFECKNESTEILYKEQEHIGRINNGKQEFHLGLKQAVNFFDFDPNFLVFFLISTFLGILK